MEQTINWWNKIVAQCVRQQEHKRCNKFCGAHRLCEVYVNMQIDNEFIEFYLPSKFKYDKLPKNHKELVDMIFEKEVGKCQELQLV